MKKGYFIPEETIRETLPSKFELILKKLKKITCGGKKAPVIFQIPQNTDTEKDLFTITNLHKIKETFDVNLKPVSKDATVQKVKKLYKIKPNANFLPLTFKQRLFLLTLLIISITSVITDYIGITLLSFLAVVPVAFQNHITEPITWELPTKRSDTEISEDNYRRRWLDDDSSDYINPGASGYLIMFGVDE